MRLNNLNDGYFDMLGEDVVYIKEGATLDMLDLNRRIDSDFRDIVPRYEDAIRRRDNAEISKCAELLKNNIAEYRNILKNIDAEDGLLSTIISNIIHNLSNLLYVSIIFRPNGSRVGFGGYVGYTLIKHPIQKDKFSFRLRVFNIDMSSLKRYVQNIFNDIKNNKVSVKSFNSIRTELLEKLRVLERGLQKISTESLKEGFDYGTVFATYI